MASKLLTARASGQIGALGLRLTSLGRLSGYLPPRSRSGEMYTAAKSDLESARIQDIRRSNTFVGIGQAGKFLAAALPLNSGLNIIWNVGTAHDRPSAHTIQVTDTLHMDCTGDIRFTNHSCEPNAKMVPTYEGCYLEAVRDIGIGEAVTFDYDTTEWDMSAPFDCLCGSPGCKGRIAGFKHAAPTARQAMLLSGMVSDYVRKMDSRRARN